MSDCNTKGIIKMVAGSYKKFDVTLEDEDTNDRIDLTGMTSGKIIIKTGTGASVEKVLTVPGPSPKLGNLEVELLSTETALFDKDTTSFEIELIDSATHKHIYLGENLLEVKERL